MVLTLYKLNGSPPARSAMMTIEALGIPNVEFVDVNLLEAEHLKEEYMKLNPQHTIPLLKDDDFTIWDSHAIATYLITKYGKDDYFYPTDPQKRAVIDQRLHFDSGVLFPAIIRTTEAVLFRGENKIQPDGIEKIIKAYDFTEKFLTGDWMAGDHITIADICCVSSISSLNELVPIDSKTYPKITAWVKRCAQQEFYKKRNVPGLLEFRALLKSKLG